MTSPAAAQRDERIRELARSLKLIDTDAKYVAATLSAIQGRIQRSFFSHFAGFPEGVKPGEGVEFRQASIADPHIMSANWDKMGQEWIVVNNLTALVVFIRYGGNALIAEHIAREHFAEYMEPHVCISRGAGGFVRQDATFRELKSPRPRPPQRKRILERDDHKCQICGCRQSDGPDVELQLHHIRPFSQNGPTFDENLITLCKRCHQSLDPHYQPDLYWSTDGPLGSVTNSKGNESHRLEVDNYRRLVARKIDSLLNQNW